MRGFNIVEVGHVVQILKPQAVATSVGTVTSEFFNMENWGRANIILEIGERISGSLVLLVRDSTSATVGDSTARAFSLYPESATPASDVPGARTAVAATGHTLVGTVDNVFAVIDINAQDLTDGSPWVGIQLTGFGSVADVLAAYAILSGGRHQKGVTATAK